MSKNNFEYFSSSISLTKPKKMLLSKPSSQETSKYFQNSLKNVVDYDLEIWKQKNTLSEKWNQNGQEKHFVLDFQKLAKNNPETITAPSVRKTRKSPRNLMKTEVIFYFFFVIFYNFVSKSRFYPDKTPPLGIYDVDHCKFAMQRSPQCLINNDYVSSHEYYFKFLTTINNEKRFKDDVKGPPLSDRIERESEKNYENTSECYFKNGPRRLKDNEMWKELKKKDELSVKVLKNYDSNFWDKFLGGIKSLKEHIKKVRYISNSVGYGDSAKLTQILKSNML